MRLLIVPSTWASVGSSRAAAQADVVVTKDGRVLKDRDGNTFARSIRDPSPPEDPPALFSGRSSQSLRDVVEAIIERGTDAVLDYEAKDGDVTRGRRIRPLRIEGTTLIALDLDKDDGTWDRTFRLNGIIAIRGVSS